MVRRFCSRVAAIFGVGMLLVAGSASNAPAQPQPGYVLMEDFKTFNAGIRKVTLRGTLLNKCTAPLPGGSFLQIGYDTATTILLVPLTALKPGQSQRFSSTVPVPPTQKTNNTTLLEFAVTVPGALPDQKTSPCTVEFFQPS
jgi:hypothetical protein